MSARFIEDLDLEPLEIACGTVLGNVDSVAPLPRGGASSARQAMETCLLEALVRPPCVVSFSGGRDSSALLSLAAHIARREQLPLPIAVSLRFPGDPDADETQWQELVISHLSIADWMQVVVEPSAYDLAGPSARAALQRHGLLFPANAFFVAEMAALATGGSHVTGNGGDEMFDTPAPHFVQAMFLRSRPRRSDVKHALTHRHRTRTQSSRLMQDAPWLTPDAQHEAGQRLASTINSRSVLWSRSVRQWVADRYYYHSVRSRVMIADDYDAQAVDPFYDRRVMTAIAAEAGSAGYRSRTDAMQRLFGDVLPRAVIERATKATFTRTAFGDHFRGFVNAWDGTGLDESLVVPELLAAEWSQPLPNFRTALLLHQLLIQDQTASPRVDPAASPT